MLDKFSSQFCITVTTQLRKPAYKEKAFYFGLHFWKFQLVGPLLWGLWCSSIPLYVVKETSLSLVARKQKGKWAGLHPFKDILPVTSFSPTASSSRIFRQCHRLVTKAFGRQLSKPLMTQCIVSLGHCLLVMHFTGPTPSQRTSVSLVCFCEEPWKIQRKK
jgi:hypothetical protein